MIISSQNSRNIFNITTQKYILLLDCQHSHGLPGLDFSHYGHWSQGRIEMPSYLSTPMWCASNYMEDGVAIDISPNKCFHYKDKADIVISNAIYEYSHTGVHKKHRAYKKCSGNNMEIFDFGNNIS